MSVFNIFGDWDRERQYQALAFAADGRLNQLLFQRIREIESEICDLDPEGHDPVLYTRRSQALHARKAELKDLMGLLQEIKLANQPQQQEE